MTFSYACHLLIYFFSDNKMRLRANGLLVLLLCHFVPRIPKFTNSYSRETKTPFSIYDFLSTGTQIRFLNT
jgi:hypothetical protein